MAASYLAEGASIPTVNVRVKENLVHLNKRGRMLVASYEALRFQKLDLFSVMLKQIGQYIQKAQLEDAVRRTYRVGKTVLPREEFRPLYDRTFPIYQELYQTLLPVYQQLKEAAL